jgi:4-amino-4-deoxy-L-arabinose transferase-like glycosyltransferase
VFPIIFFSFSQSKLPSYILPAVPAIALLCAIGFPRISHTGSASENTAGPEHTVSAGHIVNSVRIDHRRVGMAVAITWIILGASLGLWMHRIPPSAREALGHFVLAGAIIAIVGGIAMLYFNLRGGPSFVAASLFLVVLLLQVANLGILPALDPYISARWHAQLMSNDLHPDRIFTYRLQRSWNYGLNFYFGRELPEWSPADPNPALVLTSPAGLESIRRLHRLNSTLDEPYKGILYVPVGPKPR